MYLVVNIDEGGYIRTVGDGTTRLSRTIHKETRGANEWPGCFDTLAAARAVWETHTESKAILELDKEGGGKAIWMRDSQRDLLIPRLSLWKGCYGLWPISKLN